MWVVAAFGHGQGIPQAPLFDAGWTKETWTADERPYLQVRREIEARFLGRKVSERRTDLCDTTERMIVAARANPKDPVLLYRAAYYGYLLGGLDYSPEARQLLSHARLDLGSLPSPHSREFTRLRMLREGFLHEAFVDLGERLYRFDPSDREIAVKLAWIHARFGLADPRRALDLSETLLKRHDPKRYPAIYYVYGLAHHAMYSIEPTKVHAEQAKWGYRQYLAAGPSWRRKANEVKTSLEGFEKYLATHPTPPRSPSP